MGEIHVNMYSTLDGVIEASGGPDPESTSGFEYGGWQAPYFDPESGPVVIADVQSSDALLLGRRTYDIFRTYWPSQNDEIGEVFNRVPKYVVSRGTPELSWSGTTQIKDVETELPTVRQRHRAIHTWGSADLLQTLLRTRLFDRLNLWVYPVVLGQGLRVFPDGCEPTTLRLSEPPTAFPKGGVLLRYIRLDGLPQTGRIAAG
jgi:dihydrofolate reductase